MREVDIAIRKIKVRRHNSHAHTAALHGIKIPMIVPKEPDVELDPELAKKKALSDERTDALMKSAIENKRREMSRGNK